MKRWSACHGVNPRTVGAMSPSGITGRENASVMDYRDTSSISQAAMMS